MTFFRLMRFRPGMSARGRPLFRLALCVVASLLALLLSMPPALAETQPLVLSSRLVADQRDLAIAEADWHWLREKRELVLGVAAQGHEPLEMIQRDGAYEGIAADATTLIGQLLRLQITVRQYPDRDSLLRALAAHQVDLAVGSDQEGQGLPITHSVPLTQDRLALFRRYEWSGTFPKDLAGTTIATPPGLAEQVAQRYPRARLVEAASVEDALSMVAFGQVDLLAGDLLSVYYRLNRAFYGLVRFERTVEHSETQLGFLVHAEDQALQRGLDGALRAAGRARLDEICRGWVGSLLIPLVQSLPLSVEEAKWVEQHPVVRLVINDDLAPLAFFDEQGKFRGIAADVLEIVSQRTGLQFVAQSRAGSVAEQIEILQREDADLAVMTSSKAREQLLRFSHPVSSSPFVLVAQADAGLRALEPGNAKDVRLALARGHVARDHMLAAYPGIRLVEAESTLDALNLVHSESADYALVALANARYYTTRLFNDQLVIAALALIDPATDNFAMRRADGELQAILDKTLSGIPPNELNAMANRWRGTPGMSPQSWRDYGTLIQRILLGAAGVVLLVLAWVLHLRREIRRRKHVERKLNDELRFIEALTDGMPPPIYVRDAEGRLLSANRSYLESIGLPLEQVRGHTVLDLPEETFESAIELHRLYLRAMSEGRMVQGVHPIRLQGRELWVDYWIQPFQDSTGEVKGIIGGWLDITEHRRLIEELEAAKNLADEASRAKTTFLATMSHEIRTPMNAVIGILELALKRAEDAPIDRASIVVAYSSAHGLLELIGDILDIARIESGRLSLAPRRANLRELVESVARVFDGLARQKGLELVLDIDSSIGGDVLVDGLRFKQVLANLVSNAIKFTHEGSVRLSIQGEEPEPGLLQVQVCVEDTGIGISEADQQRLFRPFSQVQRGFHQAEGAGLGLIISRSLCEMMGGRLSLESTPGKGTRVEVELRLHRLDPIEEVPSALVRRDRSWRRLRVLVVDDHPVNRQILAQQLGYLGHEVVEAEDGVAALASWRAEPFDVVVTDCHMPRMNGAELARAIRAEERARQLAPTSILGLTADAQQEEVECAIQAGMDDCLIKPIGLDVLADILCQTAPELPLETDAQSQAATDAPGLFDLLSLATLTGGDAGLIRNLLSELLSANRRDLGSLTSLADQGDAMGLAELAHRLKGAGRVVRADRLVAACERLEQACHAPSPEPEFLQERADDLLRAMRELDHALEAHLALEVQ
ncbi:transporter substrate-binding domain-containing protein [Pseudomonas sp. BN102]|uniref:ATP-binding protein n=1 Tax=Pseudomonas sp. BN102 TaxID=2567886 RepID=UPI002456B7B6|nr:transporter substrate-binding domain-containing protein [Pseudomonas sp. BN102]